MAAFGLPEGTIRATLAIIVTLTTCGLYVTTGQIPAGLLSLTTLAWGVYFGQKIKGG